MYCCAPVRSLVLVSPIHACMHACPSQMRWAWRDDKQQARPGAHPLRFVCVSSITCLPRRATPRNTAHTPPSTAAMSASSPTRSGSASSAAGTRPRVATPSSAARTLATPSSAALMRTARRPSRAWPRATQGRRQTSTRSAAEVSSRTSSPCCLHDPAPAPSPTMPHPVRRASLMQCIVAPAQGSWTAACPPPRVKCCCECRRCHASRRLPP